jgi:hypothetical protein
MRYTAILLLVVLVATSCDKPTLPKNDVVAVPKPPTVVSLTVKGRTVRATIAGSATAEVEGDAAVFTSDKHKFVVEPERFTIDGVELLKLRPSVDWIEFYLSHQGYFTMNADYAGVAAKQLPSANPFCKQQTGGATRLDGRVVHYSMFGDSTISPEGDTAVITANSDNIVVERERVTMNDEKMVALSPTAKDVRVSLTEDGRFNVQSDGYTVLSKQLSK